MINWHATIRLIIPFLSSIFCASCAKEQLEREEIGGEPEIVRLSLGATAEQGVKANLLSFPDFHWEYSDQIKVFGNSSSAVFTVKAGSIDGGSAIFEGEIASSGESLLAVYPAPAARGVSSSRVILEMPARQYIPAGNNVDPGALLCIAKQNGSSLSFKNAFGLVRVSISGSGVTGIVIEGKGSTVISGTVEMSSTPLPEVTKVLDGGKIIDVRPEGFGEFAAGTYYIPVLPTVLSEGVNVGVRTSMCEEQTIGTSESVSIPRNGGVIFESVDQAASAKTPVVTIRQAVDFNELYLDNAFSGEAIVGNDVDMDGESEAGYPFAGTLDGKGHTVYNFLISDGSNASFFSAVSGEAEISDIAFGTKDGNTYDGVSSIYLTASDGSSTAGIIGTVSSSATLRLAGVSNYASISASLQDGVSASVGGVCGEWAGAGAASEVSNHSSVSVTVAGGSTASTASIGGVVGHSKGGTSFSSCVNTGSITSLGGNNSKADNYVGGIVGQMSQNPGSIEWCTNSGTISNSMSRSQKYYTGGIAGMIGKASLLRRCVNNADISQSGAAGFAYFAGIAGSIDGADPEIYGCTNNGNVRNFGLISGSSANLRMAGIVANPKGGSTGVVIRSCTNNGIVSNVSATLQPCLGGIVGDNTSYPVTMESCINNKIAAISSISQSSETIAQCNVGGIIGLSSANGILCKDCENYANVTVQNLGSTTLMEVGGLIGRSGNAQVQGCRSNCSVTTSSASTLECGIVAGRVGGSATVKTTGVAGTLCGNKLTLSNWTGCITGVNGIITTDGGPESCYLIDASEDADITIKVGSFNLWRPLSRISDRSTYPEISEYRLWQYAVPAIAQTIADMNCDIIGFVELYSAEGAAAYTDTSVEMVEQTDAAMGNKYSWQLHFPNKAGGEYSYCNGFAYNSTRLEIVEAPVRIWLNRNTGDYSTTILDGYRTLVYVKMREKASGMEFWFAVTHLDLDTVEHNLNTAKAVVKWANTVAGHNLPCILVGDMNCSSGIRASGYSTLKQYWADSYESVREQGLMDIQYLTYPATRPGDSKLGSGTEPEWEQMKEERWRWDHIFFDGVSVTEYANIFDSYTAPDNVNYWLSDHFPITATVRIASGSSLLAPPLTYDSDSNLW